MTSDPRSTQRERVTRKQWRNSSLVGAIVVSIVMTFELPRLSKSQDAYRQVALAACTLGSAERQGTEVAQ